MMYTRRHYPRSYLLRGSFSRGGKYAIVFIGSYSATYTYQMQYASSCNGYENSKEKEEDGV